ncbi:thioredoxin-like domain-containing protein [Dyella silvae]|uniref:thioredoxin-like domain-containing protein n=1 Tax=Dyella silvae TaxID=2994424 RepID=UPI002265014F|nr:thioredoxin-like domain-containing protein [Dyella silvae]
MISLRTMAAAVVIAGALAASWPGAWSGVNAKEVTTPAPAPHLAGATRWLNSPPLTIDGLHGKVVLVEFWARECINCIHVLPHTKALYDKYAKDGLVVVGVHTPEYDEERDVASLQKAMRQFQIDWPVAVDNDYRIWNAYRNQYWPAIYLIDRNGRLVYSHFGEGNYDETESQVRQLLEQAP